MKLFLFTLTIAAFNCISAQSTQTVRGQITETITGNPLPDIRITCTCSGIEQIAFSDSNGNFRLENVPVGRQSFTFSSDGFYERQLNHMDVSSGKELVLRITLNEKIETIGTATIKVRKTPREKPLNDMATVSSRQFSVEETQRYAAAVNDPARMAMGFAGVTAPDDGNNLIVIRGNAPNGLIWRMEGMDVPNPNHFSNVGSSGGGITILSAQVLNNSDFFTGAFPAEYGNGLSGVFDLNLRKGNNEKRENTIQFGLLGLDLATEGPLGNKGGSYLVNYRYSTLSMISALGVKLGDAVTKFQDLSYNVNLPLNRRLNLSIFGFTGLSNQKSTPTLDSTLWKTEPDKSYQWNFLANSIFNGAKLIWQATERHRIDIKTGVGIIQNGYNESKYNNEYIARIHNREGYDQTKFTLAVQSQYKISRKSAVRSGINYHRHFFNLNQDVVDTAFVLRNYLASKGNTDILQAYSQMQLRPTARLTVNPGIHFLYLGLNNTASMEPRLGLKYQINSKSWLSGGFGMHGQVLSIATYWVRDGNGNLPNKNLKLAKAQHFVLGYDRMFGKAWHLKTEIYHQQLYNLAVSPKTGSTFGLQNSMEGYYPDTLVSTGTGRNYGAEITLEKFFTGSTYMLLTASLSDSRYTDAHGKEWSSRFNVGHTLSFLAGKEWNIGQNRLGLNLKLLWVGGMRETTIDLAQSRSEQRTVRDYSKTFETQNPDYWRLDTKLSYKINRRKHSVTWSLDLQNSTNRSNVWGSYYSPVKNKIQYSTQAPLIPVLAWKMEF